MPGALCLLVAVVRQSPDALLPGPRQAGLPPALAFVCLILALLPKGTRQWRVNPSLACLLLPFTVLCAS